MAQEKMALGKDAMKDVKVRVVEQKLKSFDPTKVVDLDDE
jgi:hypothetical protein